MNIHTKYDVSMIMYVGRTANQRKVPNNLPFKNYKSELMFNMLMFGTYVHIDSKYEVSVFNPVARGLCTDVDDTDDADNTNDNYA